MTKNKNKQLKNSRPILRYVARVYYLKVHSVDIYNDNDNDNDNDIDNDNNNITILIKNETTSYTRMNKNQLI